LHSYDYETPLTETLSSLDDIYRTKEWFADWGLSNFSGKQVRQVMALCEDNGWRRPRYYQGMYNVMCRSVSDIFPFLQKYDLNFWAYNPLCGGLLVHGQPQRETGRYANPVYQILFGQHKPFVSACREWITLSQGDPVKTSLQWFRDSPSSFFHTHDKACTSFDKHKNHRIILGASSVSQLQQNIQCLGMHDDNELSSSSSSLWSEADRLYAAIPQTMKPCYYY
jgi:aflatoxin B1 aldehyde reductase